MSLSSRARLTRAGAALLAATGLLLTSSPGASAAVVSEYDSPAYGTSQVCHYLTMTGTSGLFHVTRDQATAADGTTITTVTTTALPGVTYAATTDPLRVFGLSGTTVTTQNRTATGLFNNTYTYNLTFTRADGTVFGTWQGFKRADMLSGKFRPTMTGTCASGSSL